MKDLKTYAEEINEAAPAQLVEILTSMTVDYACVCDMQLPLERAKMNFWIEHKKLESEKPVSDTMIKMMWMAEKDEALNGIIERRMEIYKKALEKLMSNVKAILKEKENEARNLH